MLLAIVTVAAPPPAGGNSADRLPLGAHAPAALLSARRKCAWPRLEHLLRVSGVTSANRYVTLMSPQMLGSRKTHGHGSFDLTLQDLVPGGTQVKKGDVVARFDLQYMMTRLDDYRAWGLQHENNVKRLKALLQVTRVNHEQQVLAARRAWKRPRWT